MKVCVLGCGPAGLMVAHAVRLIGHEVRIISRKAPSQLHGAQYLHEELPDLALGRPRAITIHKLGEAAGYAQKLYHDPLRTTSWERMKSGPHYGWSLQGAYEELWSMYENDIIDNHIEPKDPIRLLSDYDLVLNTVPLKFLCFNPAHEFRYVNEYIRAGELFLWERSVEPNEIVYSGLPEHAWHRASYLDGVKEYEFASQVPLGQKIVKPQSTSCDCYHETDRVIHLGRYGKWQRDELTTDAFNEAWGHLERVA